MRKFIDLTGQRFGRLTVVKRVENNKRGDARWLCQCDCGNTTIVVSGELRNGDTRSCGCLYQEIRKRIDLTGQRFGRLTVIERVENSKHAHARWLCECDCGNTTIVRGASLRSGNTRSCGCLHPEQTSRLCKTHGLCNTRPYTIWHGMKARCNNPRNAYYQDYGGRGIKVCPEWENSLETFYEWAMANGYDDTLTIDRIDNNGNYCPENCRWASMAEQQRNRRNNHYIEYNGKKQTISEWAHEMGVPQSTLSYRLKSGWSVERSLTTPVRKQKK